MCCKEPIKFGHCEDHLPLSSLLIPENKPKRDMGRWINRRAYLGSQIVSLKEQIPQVEKLVSSGDKKKSDEAKELLPKLLKQLEANIKEREELK